MAKRQTTKAPHPPALATRPLPPQGDAFLDAQVGVDGSPNTRIAYTTALRAFWEFRQSEDEPATYTPDTLSRFVLDGLSKKSPDTRQLYLSVTRKYLEFLEALEELHGASVAQMERHLKAAVGKKKLARRRRSATPAVYLVAETGELLARSAGAGVTDEARRQQERLIAFRDAAIVQVLLSTGARASEVASLARGDVDHGRADVVQVRGKGRKKRAVLLDENAQAAIQRYLRARSDRGSALFVGHSPKSSSERPEALDGRGVWRAVARLWKATLERFPEQTELKTIELSPHIFRHARGDGLAKEGASVHAIRQYLGHSSIATSQIYIDEAGDERVMEEVASFTLPRSEATEQARRRLNLNPNDRPAGR